MEFKYSFDCNFCSSLFNKLLFILHFGVNSPKYFERVEKLVTVSTLGFVTPLPSLFASPDQ